MRYGKLYISKHDEIGSICAIIKNSVIEYLWFINEWQVM